VIRAEQDLPGIEGREGGMSGGGEQGREMSQTMYAHEKKRKKKKPHGTENQKKNGFGESL
jgi:hypothetical protein